MGLPRRPRARRTCASANFVRILREAISQPSTIKTPSDPKCYSFLNRFKLLVLDPVKAIKLFNFNFEDVILWQKSFHIMRPITDEVYLNGLVERLQGSGAPVNVEMLNNSKLTDTFYSCSCEDYQHYLWCVHVCVDAMTRKLLKGFPPTLDPTKINNVKTGQAMQICSKGRPARALKGGGLGKK